MPSGMPISLPMVKIDPLSNAGISACASLVLLCDFASCCMAETLRYYGRCWIAGKQVTWTRTIFSGCTPRRLFGFRR